MLAGRSLRSALVLALIGTATVGAAQLTAEQDHQRLMNLLHIQSLPSHPPRSAGIKERKESDHREDVVEAAAAANRGRFRSRDLRPGSEACTKSDLGGDGHGSRDKGRRASHYEALDRTRGQFRIPVDYRRYAIDADYAGRCGKSGAGDYGVRVRLATRGAPARSSARSARPELAGAGFGERVGLRRTTRHHHPAG